MKYRVRICMPPCCCRSLMGIGATRRSGVPRKIFRRVYEKMRSSGARRESMIMTASPCRTFPGIDCLKCKGTDRPSEGNRTCSLVMVKLSTPIVITTGGSGLSGSACRGALPKGILLSISEYLDK